MTLMKHVIARWIPLAGLTTAMCLMVYLGVQQSWRHSANDPQVQIAHDTARLLSSGRSAASVLPAAALDMSQSLAPFIAVYDESGKVIATSGYLRGQARAIPAGVLTSARQHGEARVTWQPEPGVRIASVVVPYGGPPAGFVLAGRSMMETESRTAQFGQLLGLAWAATLAGLLVLVAASEYLLRT